MNDILNLKKAIEKGNHARGLVYIKDKPEMRSGKRNDYMNGFFHLKEKDYPFKVWESDVYDIILEYGTGIYVVETVGSEFRGAYLTVTDIDLYPGTTVTQDDFLVGIPRYKLEQMLADVAAELMQRGTTEKCWNMVDYTLRHEALEDRFMVEGAAIKHHDNIVGGLANHTIKMLRILSALLVNNPPLVESADLLTYSIFMHDIGKVFEYRDLSTSEYWYANHRVRGIEFLSHLKDEILVRYDEEFYRQVQSVIAGHHGLYGDHPTTVAATIVHYIDVLESQTTELISQQQAAPGDRLRHPDFGFLQMIPLAEESDDPAITEEENANHHA